MAPLEVTIEKERDDNWYNRHAENYADERQSNEVGFDRVPRARGKIGTDR